MAYDTPARIAVIGAGPIGLEAAIYARFLGYEVSVFERGELAQSTRSRANDILAFPCRQLTSSLGLAAIRAQNEAYQPLSPEARVCCGEWLHSYLLPLATSDLLVDSIRTQTAVIDVLFQGDPAERDAGQGDTVDEEESQGAFLIRLSQSGVESFERADIVLEITGSLSSGSAGGPGMTRPDDLQFSNPLPLLQLDKSTDRKAAEPAADDDQAAGDDDAVQDENVEIRWNAMSFCRVHPHYYLLGSKSLPADAENPFQAGLHQIRELFAIIGDRKDLDLYSAMEKTTL